MTFEKEQLTNILSNWNSSTSCGVLDLSYIPLMERSVRSHLVTWLKNHKPSSLILQNCLIDDNAMKEILQICFHNNKLRLLNVSNNHMMSSSVMVLLQLLQRNSQVESVRLFNNDIFTETHLHHGNNSNNQILQDLMTFYKNSSHLRSICGCTSHRPILQVSSSIQYPAEIAFIITEMKKNQDIQVLALNISHYLEDIFNSLYDNKTISYLNLFAIQSFHRNNLLTNPANTFLCKIQSLLLSFHEEIPPEQVTLLMVYLMDHLLCKRKCPVTTLQLDKLPVEMEIMNVLFETLENNESIIHLALFNTYLNRYYWEGLIEILKHNKVLRIIHLDETNEMTKDLEITLENLVIERQNSLIVRIGPHEYVFGMITGPQPIDQYEVGDRIEAIYDEESWMTANIIAVTSEYKYSVQFRNGKVVSNYRGQMIRKGNDFYRPHRILALDDNHHFEDRDQLAESQHGQEPKDENQEESMFHQSLTHDVPDEPEDLYQIGNTVFARFYGDNLWYSAVVKNCSFRGLLDLQFEDGLIFREIEEHMVTHVKMEDIANIYDVGMYIRGDYVEVLMNSESNDWKRARVVRDKKNGTYDVRLENGVDELGVRGRYLRHHFKTKEEVDTRALQELIWYPAEVKKQEKGKGYTVMFSLNQEEEQGVHPYRMMPARRESIRQQAEQYTINLKEKYFMTHRPISTTLPPLSTKRTPSSKKPDLDVDILSQKFDNLTTENSSETNSSLESPVAKSESVSSSPMFISRPGGTTNSTPSTKLSTIAELRPTASRPPINIPTLSLSNDQSGPVYISSLTGSSSNSNYPSKSSTSSKGGNSVTSDYNVPHLLPQYTRSSIELDLSQKDVFYSQQDSLLSSSSSGIAAANAKLVLPSLSPSPTLMPPHLRVGQHIFLMDKGTGQTELCSIAAIHQAEHTLDLVNSLGQVLLNVDPKYIIEVDNSDKKPLLSVANNINKQENNFIQAIDDNRASISINSSSQSYKPSFKIGAKVQAYVSNSDEWVTGVIAQYIGNLNFAVILDTDEHEQIFSQDNIRPINKKVENSFELPPKAYSAPLPNTPIAPSASNVEILREGARVEYKPNNSSSTILAVIESIVSPGIFNILSETGDPFYQIPISQLSLIRKELPRSLEKNRLNINTTLTNGPNSSSFISPQRPQGQPRIISQPSPRLSHSVPHSVSSKESHSDTSSPQIAPLISSSMPTVHNFMPLSPSMRTARSLNSPIFLSTIFSKALIPQTWSGVFISLEVNRNHPELSTILGQSIDIDIQSLVPGLEIFPFDRNNRLSFTVSQDAKITLPIFLRVPMRGVIEKALVKVSAYHHLVLLASTILDIDIAHSSTSSNHVLCEQQSIESITDLYILDMVSPLSSGSQNSLLTSFLSDTMISSFYSLDHLHIVQDLDVDLNHILPVSGNSPRHHIQILFPLDLILTMSWEELAAKYTIFNQLTHYLSPQSKNINVSNWNYDVVLCLLPTQVSSISSTLNFNQSQFEAMKARFPSYLQIILPTSYYFYWLQSSFPTIDSNNEPLVSSASIFQETIDQFSSIGQLFSKQGHIPPQLLFFPYFSIPNGNSSPANPSLPFNVLKYSFVKDLTEKFTNQLTIHHHKQDSSKSSQSNFVWQLMFPSISLTNTNQMHSLTLPLTSILTLIPYLKYSISVLMLGYLGLEIYPFAMGCSTNSLLYADPVDSSDHPDLPALLLLFDFYTLIQDSYQKFLSSSSSVSLSPTPSLVDCNLSNWEDKLHDALVEMLSLNHQQYSLLLETSLNQNLHPLEKRNAFIPKILKCCQLSLQDFSTKYFGQRLLDYPFTIKLILDQHLNVDWVTSCHLYCIQLENQFHWISSQLYQDCYRNMIEHLSYQKSLNYCVKSYSSNNIVVSSMLQSSDNGNNTRPLSSSPSTVASVENNLLLYNLTHIIGIRDPGQANTIVKQLNDHGCFTWEDLLDLKHICQLTSTSSNNSNATNNSQPQQQPSDDSLELAIRKFLIQEAKIPLFIAAKIATVITRE